MNSEVRDFVLALTSFVRAELTASDEAAEYNHEAVQIVDARNHLFRNVGHHETDEEQNIYSLRSLCCVEEDSMEMIPDEGRIERVARNYFG